MKPDQVGHQFRDQVEDLIHNMARGRLNDQPTGHARHLIWFRVTDVIEDQVRINILDSVGQLRG
ncbi:MAG: hypothetical protein MIO92_10590 [Methanosarcinaceae archaeon]|jgi:hypothetical protein|nr:hypothetical protein [Methanosarcinaceae archaeon]